MSSAKTALITGSTDGLGRELARALIERGWRVLIHGRDPEKVERVREELRAADGYVAELSSLAEVRRLAEEVERDSDRLDALVNNAGLGRMPRRESADGHELVFAVNYLSHFLLTALLLPLLRRSAPARIVNVSSIGQAPIDFDDVMLERSHDPMRSYAQSKLAQILFTSELAERLGPDSGVTVNALHPATLMDTNMVRNSFGRVMSSVDEGVEATLRLVESPELEGVSGRYFDGKDESRANAQAYDPDARARLWELSEELTQMSSSGAQPPPG